MNYSTTNKYSVVAAAILLLTQTLPALALSSVGVSGGTTTGTTTRPPTLPPPPPETTPKAPILDASWKTKSDVKLAFLDTSLVETGFDMQRRSPGGTWQSIQKLPAMTGKSTSKAYRATGLAPRTSYCFRVVASNTLGSTPSNEICTRTTYAGACEEAKLEEILTLATSDGEAVEIDCDLYLEPHRIITRRLVFLGSRASGVTVDLNDSTIQGGPGTVHDGRRDMIEVRSAEVVVRDVENDISTYERPSNITISNGRVEGSIRIWGMSKNGEGDGDTKTVCESSGMCYEVDQLATNQLKKSSRLPDHTARAQRNAPTGIVLRGLTIYGSGRSPVYFAPGVTNSKLIDSHVLGYSNAVAVYLDAESAGNTFKGNVIDVDTKNYPFEQWDRPLVAIDGSARNHFIGNYFSNLSHGGIYFYRNCGENGVIRHQTPSENELINNIFYYNEYDGDNQAVFIGSRNRGGWFQDTFGFCEADAGYPYGSSAADEDFSRYNVVMQNQIFKRSLSDMIQTNNPSLNTPNYITGNAVVTEATVDPTRPAGCYNGNGLAGFMNHGASFTKNDGRTSCSATKYTCQDGEIVAQPLSLCGTVSPTITITGTAQR